MKEGKDESRKEMVTRYPMIHMPSLHCCNSNCFKSLLNTEGGSQLCTAQKIFLRIILLLIFIFSVSSTQQVFNEWFKKIIE